MTARKTKGVELQVGDGASPESFSKIASIVSINGPDGTRTEIDTTDLSSTAMEFEAGLKDEGSISFDAIWDEKETTHGDLQTEWENGDTKNYKIVVPDGSPNSELEFAAFVSQLQRQYNVNDVVRASCALRISGALTVTTS